MTKQHLDRVHRLEQRLEAAAADGDLTRAKRALDELKPILERHYHKARILQAYLKLYEAALEAWNLDVAKRGFEFVRKQANT